VNLCGHTRAPSRPWWYSSLRETTQCKASAPLQTGHARPAFALVGPVENRTAVDRARVVLAHGLGARLGAVDALVPHLPAELDLEKVKELCRLHFLCSLPPPTSTTVRRGSSQRRPSALRLRTPSRALAGSTKPD